jgi:hypothetical protein
MEELLLVAIPVALVAAAAAAVKPARERVVPVARAVGRTGAAVALVTASGTRGIVDAAIHGEGKRSDTPSGARARSSATTSSRRPRGGAAKASGARSRRQPSGPAAG